MTAACSNCNDVIVCGFPGVCEYEYIMFNVCNEVVSPNAWPLWLL